MGSYLSLVLKVENKISYLGMLFGLITQNSEFMVFGTFFMDQDGQSLPCTVF